MNRWFVITFSACLVTSCEKSETKTKSADTPAKPARIESTANASKSRDTPATPAATNAIAPISHPVDASMIRPAGTAPDAATWESLTAEEKVRQFTTNGIASIPASISEKIIQDIPPDGTSEDRLRYIAAESAGWHHVNEFKDGSSEIPEHMKAAMIDKLYQKHPKSWTSMASVIDEQTAAAAKVAEYRWKGIPGMSADESQDFIIDAMSKYTADYKTILSVIEKRTASGNAQSNEKTQ